MSTQTMAVENRDLDSLAILADGLRGLADAFIWDPPASDAQQAVDRDEHLMRDLAARDQSSSLLRLWTCPPALVAPRHLLRNPGFQAAVASSHLPVAVRSSGGTVVLHGPAFANITHIVSHSKDRGVDIDHMYSAFGEILFEVLAQSGVHGCFEQVSRAYCSGRYDVAIRGKKLAGTAALVRRFERLDAYLVHATLRMRPVPGELAMIADFERHLGQNPGYDAQFLTSFDAEAILANDTAPLS